jgi:hypothetical protein
MNDSCRNQQFAAITSRSQRKYRFALPPLGAFYLATCDSGWNIEAAGGYWRLGNWRALGGGGT